MKKLLLALMVSAGITSAYAQSSVTVYGLLDAGLIGTNYKGTGTNSKVNTSQTFLGQSAESPSRFGVKGTEDLGGGTSAFFMVETGLNPNSATASTWNNRQSYVGFRQTGVGQMAIGTQFTNIWRAVSVTDPGGLNDMPGDVIVATNMQTFGNPGSAPYADASNSQGNTGGFTTRTSNTVTFDSEKFSGVGVNGFYALNNQSQTQTSATTGGNTNYNGFGLGANYTWNKLYVTANYQALKSYISAATLTTPQPTLWTGASGGVNTQDNQKYVAATYDFGPVKGFAQWVTRKATSTLNPNYFANRTAQQIGVRGYITPTIESWASVGNGKVSAFGVSQPTANFVGYQVGSNYWLSKRTNLYAIYGQSNTSSVSASAGAVGISTYAAGVRHTF